MTDEPNPLLSDTFADDVGDKWTLRINYAQKNKLKPLGLDVCALPSEDFRPLGAFCDNADTLVPALKMLLAKQMQEREIDGEQFNERLNEKSIEAARYAFAYAVYGFFPEPLRGIMRNATARGASDASEAVKRFAAVTSDDASDAAPRPLSVQSGDSQESSETIQTATA